MVAPAAPLPADPQAGGRRRPRNDPLSAPTPTQREPSSFRDPRSRVYYRDGAVLRTLSEEGLADWQAFASKPSARRLLESEKVIATEELDPADVPAELAEAAGVLRHERVPFVSYPYEWTFGMLKDAALLQLELVRTALDDELILKDSSPYNVQWRGSRPVFIDVGSFEPLQPGEPWVGYRQFCMLYLYPLLLQAWKDVPFQPWLRGSIDGIAPNELRNLLSLRDRFRRGAFTHVYLHAKLDRRYADTSRDVKAELKKAGFKKELIAANVRGLEKVIRRLEWRPGGSAWTDYATTHSYDDADLALKQEFVAEATRSRRWRRVWDLGCNDGRFARLAAESADYVVAVDADAAVVEQLYRRLRDEDSTTILPLTMNVADPSPGLGWRGRERTPLEERGKPELTLCLALVHHVAITANVPLAEFLGWLRGLDTSVVIEFPTPDDPMVQRLLAAKRERTHVDYTRESFERSLTALFEVERSVELASGTRVLYFGRPRG